MDKDTVRTHKKKQNQIKLIIFIDNVGISKYETTAWEQSVSNLNPTAYLINLHRYWSKLEGDGEIVWGRAYSSLCFYFILPMP